MQSSSLKGPRRIRLAGLLLPLAVFALPSPVLATPPEVSHLKQPAGDVTGANKANTIARLQQRYFHLRLQVGHIEAVAVKNSPALVRKQTVFREQLIAEMKQEGSHPRAQIRLLRKLGQQLQAKNTSTTQRQYLRDRARTVQLELLTAERKALQNPKVRAARHVLRQATLSAMRKVNPKAMQLIKKMRLVQRQITRLQHQG